MTGGATWKIVFNNPLTLARIDVSSSERIGGGVRWTLPLAVSPLIELELRGKNDRVARDERKPIIPNFKVLGHRLTFQVRSLTQKSGKSGPVRAS